MVFAEFAGLVFQDWGLVLSITGEPSLQTEKWSVQNETSKNWFSRNRFSWTSYSSRHTRSFVPKRALFGAGQLLEPSSHSHRLAFLRSQPKRPLWKGDPIIKKVKTTHSSGGFLKGEMFLYYPIFWFVCFLPHGVSMVKTKPNTSNALVSFGLPTPPKTRKWPLCTNCRTAFRKELVLQVAGGGNFGVWQSVHITIFGKNHWTHFKPTTAFKRWPAKPILNPNLLNHQLADPLTLTLSLPRARITPGSVPKSSKMRYFREFLGAGNWPLYLGHSWYSI